MFPRPARPIYFSSSRCCPPDISSVLADHDEFFELPASRGRRVAYSGIRSLLRRIMFSSRHSRMGTTVLLSQLSATTELLVIDLVTQQDPESDSQLSCGCHFRFPQTFLHQLVLIKTLQLRILANCMSHRFAPQKTKKRIPLFAQTAQSLPASAGVFARDQSHIAGYCLSIYEPLRLTQKGFCRQSCDRPHSRMSHQPLCLGSLPG